VCSGRLSVFEVYGIGSALSLRGAQRCNSGISLFGSLYTGSCQRTSVMDYLVLSSSLSARSFARLTGRLSVYDLLHVGSSLSVRSFVRFSSTFSALNFAAIGSALSVRHYVRA
jgi:hypothetical protein